jgi:hypothetical protein
MVQANAAIMLKIWLCSKPLSWAALDRQDETQDPHPLQSTGFTSARPALGPALMSDGAL